MLLILITICTVHTVLCAHRKSGGVRGRGSGWDRQYVHVLIHVHTTSVCLLQYPEDAYYCSNTGVCVSKVFIHCTCNTACSCTSHFPDQELQSVCSVELLTEVP